MVKLQRDEKQGKLHYFLPQQEGETLVSLKMIEHNQIPGLVPMYRQYIDEQICFTYEVRGRKSLRDLLDQKSISVKRACGILQQIVSVLLEGEVYFLNIEEYCIETEYIYFDQREQQLLLCYLPGSQQDVYEKFRTLLEEIMKYLDHRKKKETAFFYALYDMFCAGEITLSEFQRHICLYEQESHREMEREEQTGELGRQRKVEILRQNRKQANVRPFSLILSEYRTLFQKNKEGAVSALPEQFLFETGCYRVGRQKDQDLLLLPQQISRNHALIEADQSQVYLTDQGSVNGTYVNGRKISAHVKTRLEMGDVITFADISYQLRASDEVSSNVQPNEGWRKHGNIPNVLDSLRMKLLSFQSD